MNRSPERGVKPSVWKQLVSQKLTFTDRIRVRIRVTLRLAVCRQSVRLDANPLRLTTNNFIFNCTPAVIVLIQTSSLTGGWVCRLKLLVLASAVILRSEFRGTHGHILLSQIRDSLNLEGQVLVYIYIPQWQDDPVVPPGTGFPFRRLLWLAGIWWRYSNPPLHRLSIDGISS
jgi:hypothetical protein